MKLGVLESLFVAAATLFASFALAAPPETTPGTEEQNSSATAPNTAAGKKGTQDAPSAPTERQRLLRVLSGPQVGGPKQPKLSSLIRSLKPFARSNDQVVRELARQGIHMGALGLALETNSRFDAEARALLQEAVVSAGSPTSDPVEAFTEPGGAFEQAIAHMRSLLEGQDEIRRIANAMRQRARAMADDPKLPDLGDRELVLQVKPVPGRGGLEPSSDVHLTIVNKSGRKLPAVTIVVDVAMDARKIDRQIAIERQRWDPANTIAETMGFGDLQQANMQNALMHYESLRLGYGTVIFLPSLGAGGSLKLSLASAGDLYYVVDTAKVLVVSEGECRYERSLDLVAVRGVMDQIIAKQRRKQSSSHQDRR